LARLIGDEVCLRFVGYVSPQEIVVNGAEAANVETVERIVDEPLAEFEGELKSALRVESDMVGAEKGIYSPICRNCKESVAAMAGE
jgi:hypothetical protein